MGEDALRRLFDPIRSGPFLLLLPVQETGEFDLARRIGGGGQIFSEELLDYASSV